MGIFNFTQAASFPALSRQIWKGKSQLKVACGTQTMNNGN